MGKRTEDGAIDPALAEAIAAELKAVQEDLEKPKAEREYTMTDRCRIYDRALKLAQIRIKADDEWGGEFDLPPDDPEPEEVP